VQVTGLKETATRTINRDFSRSFLRHFNSACVIGGNQLRFQRVAFMLKFPVLRLWSIAYDPLNRTDRKRSRSNYLSCRQ